MAIRVALNHKTYHKYAKPVWLSPQVVRLRPAPHSRTPIEAYSLSVTPKEHFINWQQDAYGNYLARLVFPNKTREFCVEIDLIAEMAVVNPFDFFVEKEAESFPFDYGDTLRRELSPYLEKHAIGPKFDAFLAANQKPAMRTIDFLVGINQQLQNNIKYVIRLEPGVQAPEQTLTCLSGSCRDSSWLLVNVLRHFGLATRFVSGYLIQLVPDVKPLEGPTGATTDFTDLHAWVEVYLPGAGWVGLDPTSGLMTGEGHIPLAASAEPTTAAAITGSFSYDDADIVNQDPEIGDHPAPDDKDEFEFNMSVKRVHEDPRVTKPYTDEQWAAIDKLGKQVDVDLEKGDVRLTMGGEPTFVAIEGTDDPQWNTDALGERKYEMADKLIRRLRSRFSTGGFLHHGQGKWYPGEQLPRWSLGLYWRKDGQPIWTNYDLVADEQNVTKYVTEHDAHTFIKALAKRLGVNPDHAQPGYEDVWYYLWKERRLPVNVDPFESHLADELARARIARVFEQGLEKTVGYALPLKRVHWRGAPASWVSGPWFFRPERMYLVPGDSPMGFRLPLESIPWVAPGEFPHLHERDPSEKRGPLPDRALRDRERDRERDRYQQTILGAPEASTTLGRVEQVLDPEEVGPESSTDEPAFPEIGSRPGEGAGELAKGLSGLSGPGGPGREGAVDFGFGDRSGSNLSSRATTVPERGRSAADTVRTALCTEVRKGVLRVFVPPQRYIEDYLDLIAAIEDTAALLRTPVLVEGYTPPYDPRVQELKVTPDPGVIEVNTFPVRTWDELVKNTNILNDEARATRLGTEKFMVDGRHVGTGGGNHIVMGGESPADSPLLRRPDLLRSMLGYWHNHPSLSYLFSGMFVGPTSQAPRVDEARNDQVYELEIAFNQIPDYGHTPAWLVDRIFRNLLVDSTGNTHRAEFCIDKLYAPESPTGRLGLLEMRGFEMPPHPRMSLTQHLLLRALIAHFWHEPYKQPLVRWRTEIHDRFLLPHFVKQDLEDVCADLAESGYALKPEWFAPHMEFRFPLLGTIEQRGIVMDLRQAIEPWHVLGETPGIGSTVRYVDSSLERIEVFVRGMTDPRHKIIVNGVTVPLHPTGTNGQYVAGVRFRAWQPATALHPTIGRHAPLVFDIYDTWSGRSVGGGRYHVSHPGGRSYDTAPVNAYEAESRRINRFFKFGHTPGPMSPIDVTPSKEFPFTLDLRKYLS